MARAVLGKLVQKSLSETGAQRHKSLKGGSHAHYVGKRYSCPRVLKCRASEVGMCSPFARDDEEA